MNLKHLSAVSIEVLHRTLQLHFSLAIQLSALLMVLSSICFWAWSSVMIHNPRAEAP